MPNPQPKPLQFDPSAIITQRADRQAEEPTALFFRFQGQKPFCVLLTQRASPLHSDSAHFRAGWHTRGQHVMVA